MMAANTSSGLYVNAASNLAFEPVGAAVEMSLTSDQGQSRSIVLTEEHRLILVGPGQYQIITGGPYYGWVLSLSWEYCREILRPVTVFRPRQVMMVDSPTGRSVMVGYSDRFVFMPATGAYLAISGPHQGAWFDGSLGQWLVPVH